MSPVVRDVDMPAGVEPNLGLQPEFGIQSLQHEVPVSEITNFTESDPGSSGFYSPDNNELSQNHPNHSMGLSSLGYNSAPLDDQGNDQVLLNRQRHESAQAQSSTRDSSQIPTDEDKATFNANHLENAAICDQPSKSQMTCDPAAVKNSRRSDKPDTSNDISMPGMSGNWCYSNRSSLSEILIQDTIGLEESDMADIHKSLGEDPLVDVVSMLNTDSTICIFSDSSSVGAISCNTDSLEHTETPTNDQGSGESSLQNTADIQTSEGKFDENYQSPSNNPSVVAAARMQTMNRGRKYESASNNSIPAVLTEHSFTDTIQLNEFGNMTLRESVSGNEEMEDLEVVDGAVVRVNPENSLRPISADVEIHARNRCARAQSPHRDSAHTLTEPVYFERREFRANEHESGEASFLNAADIQTPGGGLAQQHVFNIANRASQLEIIRQENNNAGIVPHAPQVDNIQLNENEPVALGNITLRVGEMEDLEVVDGAVGGVNPENSLRPISADVEIHAHNCYAWALSLHRDSTRTPTVTLYLE